MSNIIYKSNSNLFVVEGNLNTWDTNYHVFLNTERHEVIDILKNIPGLGQFLDGTDPWGLMPRDWTQIEKSDAWSDFYTLEVDGLADISDINEYFEGKAFDDETFLDIVWKVIVDVDELDRTNIFMGHRTRFEALNCGLITNIL